MSFKVMGIASPLSENRVRRDPVAVLPEVWCATLETAYRPGNGLSAFLHCVRPDELEVSIRVHLRFGMVPAYWRTEDHVDPWLSSSELRPKLCNAKRCLPLLEVHP